MPKIDFSSPTPDNENQDRARQFDALRADLEKARQQAEAGSFAAFDPKSFEPDAFKERPLRYSK